MTRTQVYPEPKPQANPSHRQPGIRRAGAGDRDAIREFFASLSPRSRYLRFFTNACPKSAAMLAVLAGGGDNVDVVVAVENGAIIGHAMAVDTNTPTGTPITDIGVVVADSWQGHGIGSVLVRRLTARAQARGVSAASMDVLAENRQVLAMIANHWPAATYERSAAHVTVRAPLSPQRRHEPGRRSQGLFSPRRLDAGITRKRPVAA